MADALAENQPLITDAAEARGTVSDQFLTNVFAAAGAEQKQVSDLIAEQVCGGPAAEFRPLAAMTSTEQIAALQEFVATPSAEHPMLRNQINKCLDVLYPPVANYRSNPEHNPLDSYTLPYPETIRTLLDLDRRWKESQQQT